MEVEISAEMLRTLPMNVAEVAVSAEMLGTLPMNVALPSRMT
jgi:hypothetical protein